MLGVGDCEFHDQDGVIIRGNVVYNLQPRDHGVLRLLIENAPHVVAYEDILAAVWSNKVVGDTVLYQSVGRLRRAFGDAPAASRYIQTVTKRGYRLLATVVAMNATRNDDRRPPMAILDFEPLSKGRATAQAAIMLAAELRSELVQRDVAVMIGQARRSGGAQVDFPALAELGVEKVLTGSVAKDEADVVRVQASLYNVSSRLLLWSGRYDASRPFTFSRQSEIAAQISDEVIKQQGN